jgi:hypothetical protein
MNADLRIPLSVRSTISRICKVQPIRSFGIAGYAWAAEYCAKSLSAIPNVEALFLRGKPIAEYDPGISDFDFWLFLPESVLADFKTLEHVRRVYLSLRKNLVIPGKIEVTSVEAWNLFTSISPSWTLPYLPRQQFIDGKWLDSTLSEPRDISPKSLFPLAAYHYSLAVESLGKAIQTKYSYFYLREFTKQVGKVLAFIDGKSSPGCSFSSPTKDSEAAHLAARMFLGLHRLAASAAPGETKQFAPCNWNGFALARGDIPKTLVWTEASPDLAQAERLFLELIRAQKFEYLVSAPMYQILLRGCPWVAPLENLRWLSEDEEQGIRPDAFRYVEQRWALRINSLFGTAASYSIKRLHKPLLYFCIKSVVVASGEIARDLRELSQRASQLPKTAALLRRLLQGEELLAPELIAKTVEVRSEVWDSIASKDLVNAQPTARLPNQHRFAFR